MQRYDLSASPIEDPPMIAKIPLAAIICAAMFCGQVDSASQANVECWKRLSDGDVHADTGKFPKLSSGFKVLSFKANRKDAEWIYGTCVLAPRK